MSVCRCWHCRWLIVCAVSCSLPPAVVIWADDVAAPSMCVVDRRCRRWHTHRRCWWAASGQCRRPILLSTDCCLRRAICWVLVRVVRDVAFATFSLVVVWTTVFSWCLETATRARTTTSLKTSDRWLWATAATLKSNRNPTVNPARQWWCVS